MSSPARRAAMIQSQLMVNDVTDAALLHAMGEIPREQFVPAALEAVAYMDVPVKLPGGRVLLDGRCFGKLAQLAAIRSTDKVLDVACGTGYSTAVLARLASHVTGLEEDAGLVQMAAKNLAALGIKNADAVRGKLTEGLPSRAPFDAIFVNGAVEISPQQLLDQLADGGRLVCVRREGASGQGTIYVRSDGAIGERSVFGAQLPVLPGFQKAAGFVF
jgi:protein-L-isoaspartate(D-aspartate) O-methyltransferase